ncbi:unnamed protein product [Peronospora destructor]|uniref:DUF4219 domain-containing protein n=1 Tax=Peronospora destructor TaxID=86335 RepID=A0AAV0V738_9STRA|nr:unnamed protein product [Peronospora destructor]
MDSSPARINKLDGTNFHAWKFKMQMVLEERDLWEVVSGEVKLEHCVTTLDQATLKRSPARRWRSSASRWKTRNCRWFA